MGQPALSQAFTRTSLFVMASVARVFSRGRRASRGHLALVVLLAQAACRDSQATSCTSLQRAKQWEEALERCAEEARGPAGADAKMGIATAAFYMGRYGQAETEATRLLESPRAADAHAIMGSVALMKGDLVAAERHLSAALDQHERDGNQFAVARDAHQLAGAALKQGRIERAMELIDVAAAASELTGDSRMATYAEIGRADILRQVGDLESAINSIENAITNASEPSDRVIARMKGANLELELGHWGIARKALIEAGSDEERNSNRKQIRDAISLNLAFAERQLGNLEEALRLVSQSTFRDGQQDASFYATRGMILADTGRLAEAEIDLARAESMSPRGEWSWAIPYQAALVAERQGDISRAIAAHWRAIGNVTALANGAGRLGARLVASHRQPHLHLIGLLGKFSDWHEVVRVVATMDSQALLRSKAEPIEFPSSDYYDVVSADPVDRAVAPIAVDSIIESWRGRRLIVMVPGGGRIFRILIEDGKVDGSDVGSEKDWTKMAVELQRNPFSQLTREAIRTRLLGETAKTQVAELLVVGKASVMPLASLNLDSHDKGTVVRAAGLLPRSVLTKLKRPKGALVIGDPLGDLPASRSEAQAVATRLSGSLHLGSTATMELLFKKHQWDVLHFATHIRRHRDEMRLLLANGGLGYHDIINSQISARLVVIAACGGSIGIDDYDTESLADAFLRAGADTVVTTRWPIIDRDAALIVDEFYRRGGVEDPITALRLAQGALRLQVDPRTWAAFEVVLGRPTCRTTSCPPLD